MCVSLAESQFTGTIIYAGRCRHAEHGPIETFGYQNTAANLAEGPNAMVLHLPTQGMTPEQFLPVGRYSDVLTRMADAVRAAAERERGGPSLMGVDVAAHVFDHDIYTVVLASDPAGIPEALWRVPPRRRPNLSPELFDFYATSFPGHTVALCCFDNRDALRAKPLMVWYEPLDFDVVTMPGVDCHTGGAPDLDAIVARDHVLIFGTDEAEQGWGASVAHPPDLRHRLRAFLPDRVCGVRVAGASPEQPLARNGDFAIDYADLLAGRVDRVRRLAPS
jgi:hypothetical protein